MATRTLRTNNAHKPHPTHCDTCYRPLPKRAFRRQCATCIKQERSIVRFKQARKAARA